MNAAALAVEGGLTWNPYYEIFTRLELGLDDLGTDLRSKLAAIRAEMGALALLLDGMKPGKLYTFDVMRRLRQLFAFGIPHPEGISRLAAFGRITEIGAGNGYWASLLTGAGAQVSAYDDFSWKKTFISSWFPVQEGGPGCADDDTDLLFLCWPPYDDTFASECLLAYRGDHLAYCGEGEGGCTADARFFDLLEEEWRVAERLPHLRWPGIHDTLTIYRRR